MMQSGDLTLLRPEQFQKGNKEDKNLQLATGSSKATRLVGVGPGSASGHASVSAASQPRFLSLTKAGLYCPCPGLDLSGTQPPMSIGPASTSCRGLHLTPSLHFTFTSTLLPSGCQHPAFSLLQPTLPQPTDTAAKTLPLAHSFTWNGSAHTCPWYGDTSRVYPHLILHGQCFQDHQTKVA